ncbi:MAG: hypothetical protein WDW38_002029 [Sanguina aurantia]
MSFGLSAALQALATAFKSPPEAAAAFLSVHAVLQTSGGARMAPRQGSGGSGGGSSTSGNPLIDLLGGVWEAQHVIKSDQVLTQLLIVMTRLISLNTLAAGEISGDPEGGGSSGDGSSSADALCASAQQAAIKLLLTTRLKSLHSCLSSDHRPCFNGALWLLGAVGGCPGSSASWPAFQPSGFGCRDGWHGEEGVDDALWSFQASMFLGSVSGEERRCRRAPFTPGPGFGASGWAGVHEAPPPPPLRSTRLRRGGGSPGAEMMSSFGLLGGLHEKTMPFFYSQHV